MAGTANVATKRLHAVFEAVASNLQDDAAWSPLGPYHEQLVKLFTALEDLVAVQDPFKLVDAGMPYAAKSDRMMAWLRAHEGFSAKKLRLVDNLPAERGSRGVVAEEPIATDDVVMCIPASVMMSSSGAMRTKDLGLLAVQKQLSLAELPTVLLALHLLVEHTKCVVRDERPLPAAAGADAGAEVPILKAPSHDFSVVGEDVRAAAAAAGIDLAALLAGDEEEEDDHGHGHGGAGGGSHGHSHGGKPCHGHGHGGASEKLPEPAPAPAAGSHGHSHGGKPCHGHGHGSAAPAPAPAPAAGSHGHSHGGKPCHGHGHGAKAGSHGHGHGGHDDEAPAPLIPVDLAVEPHPWGSAYRPYLAMLPARPSSCLFFSASDISRMAGLPALFEIARFVRNTATTYLKLLSTLGPAGNAIRGFAPHMSWAGFRWAMSIVMSRQNRVPILAGTDPLANGVDFTLAAVPLYDMVNSRPGKITSYFTAPAGAGLGATGSFVLEAPADVAAGEEVTMSYGGRSVHQLLQYQGYVPAEAVAAVLAPTAAAPTAAAGGAGGAGDAASASPVTAAAPVDEFAFVEASMGGLASDPLFKIRANVLRTLEIQPEQAAARYLQTPQVRGMMMQAMRAAGGTPGAPASPAARDAVERIMWSQPFSFQLYANGEPSADLVSFLRVAAIDGKADAAIALRACDVARQSLTAKIAELRAKQAARMQAARAKRLAKASAAAEAAAAAGGSPPPPHHHDDDHHDDEEDSDDGEGDEPAYFTLSLTKLSDDNELAATLALVQVLQYSLEKAEAGVAAAAATAAAAGSAGKKDKDAKAAAAAASTAASAAAEASPVTAYVDMQIAILKRGLDKARAKLAELAAASGIAGEAGADAAGAPGDAAAAAPAAPAAAAAMK